MTVDDWPLKVESMRILDPRWMHHRAYILRECGYTWVEIAVALDRHETTVRQYYRTGEKENRHFGTLHYYLSIRARKWLINQGIDPAVRASDDVAARAVRRKYGVRRSGLGRATRDEILNAIDLLREIRPALLT